MPTGTGISDDTREAIRVLHAQGLGRNAIARELGIAADSVSRYARDAGLSFDRTASEEASRARKADLLERRTRLELDYLIDAERLRREVYQTREYAQVAGSETGPQVVRYTMDIPTPADQLKLMQASTIAAAASQKIADAAVDQSAATAKSMLVHMMTGLQDAFRAVQAADLEPDQPGDTP